MSSNTIILVPGLVCDAAVWQAEQPALSKIAPVIIPDLSTPDTPEKMVAAVLEKAPPTFALAGHSMGGWVALEVMRTAPERVSKLALLNTSASLDPAIKAEARREMIAMAEAGRNEELTELLLSVYIYNQDCRPAVKTMIARNLHAFINQEHAMQARKDCTPLLKTITCPTLIIHANQDVIFNIEDAETLHQNIAGSVLKRVDQSGHMSPMEAPAEVTRLLTEWAAN